MVRTPVIYASLVLTLTSCATVDKHANEAPAVENGHTIQIRGALSGQRQRIATFYATAPDCRSLGYPTLKVAKAPQHGEVSVEEGVATAMFGENDPRRTCNGREVPATVIYYTSVPGFIGADSVAFDRIGVEGAYGYHVYRINVR
jgi:hypothetical protein